MGIAFKNNKNVGWRIEVLPLGCKKIISRWMLYFNIMQVEMGCVIFVSTQHDSIIKCVKWVGSGQPALLTVRIRIEKSWHD